MPFFFSLLLLCFGSLAEWFWIEGYAMNRGKFELAEYARMRATVALKISTGILILMLMVAFRNAFHPGGAY